MAKLTLKKIKSTINQPANQKRTMEALGLRRMGQTNTFDDSPQLRGMIAQVRHLVSVEEA